MEFDGPAPDARVRTLTEADLQRLVSIDAQYTGQLRAEYFRGRLRRAFSASDVQVSLGAEVDGTLVGAVLAEVQFGEYGRLAPVAVLDTVLVDRAFAGKGVANALLDQMVLNLQALRVERIRTEVAWDQQPLLAFFARSGFAPAPRFVLERSI